MLDGKKLQILTESAKYDVSCSSSGSKRSNNGGLGNTAIGGICHSFTQDGRCISLLKILLSNDCAYDCKYCVNRCSNSVERATADPDEICELVISFYKRNYIEGLFLSSAIYKNPNYTMELLYETVRKLRYEYRFNGYIHLKGIPNADSLLIERAGFLVDRMSFNIELPSENSLKLLAPQKSKTAIITPMKMLALDKYYDSPLSRRNDFLPAGQTTQMIIGASGENDTHILKLTEYMYNSYKLKRVYYSSYLPVNFNTGLLPFEPAPKIREHRLYQADWLLRFYNFTADEITANDGNLPLEYDPKCSWAIRHPEFFPVEINKAPLDCILRVPGIGITTAKRIIKARRHANLTFDDLKKMRVVLKRAVYFITCSGKYLRTNEDMRMMGDLIDYGKNYNPHQLSMFDESGVNMGKNVPLTALTGEL